MDDKLTQQHAFVIAHTHGIAPYDTMKCERCLNPPTDVNSVWLATSDGQARCFVQYHADHLIGLLCDSCWGKDKPFGDYPTPKTVNARFRDIWSCPEYAPAPNVHFTLVQDPDEPCHFSVKIPNWFNSEALEVHWWACTNGSSTLSVFLSPSGSSYFLKTGCICEVSFENSHTECDEPDVVGYGGTSLIVF